MVKSTERVCYYETLGLEPNCSEEQIKAAHRKLILTYHWDKCRSSQCGLSQEEATAKFLEIRLAYETLIDPERRETFDAYRQTYAVPEVFKPDLEIPFDNVHFDDYSSSVCGFYEVYSDLFQRIYDNERAFQEKKNMPWNSVQKPPDMGNLDSSYPEVVQFYNYWLNFDSIMDFCWEDLHDEIDLRNVSRRRRMKLWSRINMKARKKAKKEYIKKIRGLAQNAKRLDKRVMQMMEKREEEQKSEIEEKKERRKQLRKEKLTKAMEYVEQEWTKPIERKRKYSNEEEEKKKENEEWECVVCRKTFRSVKQCRNHEQSRKHLRLYAKLMELLLLKEKCDNEEPDEKEVLKVAKWHEVIGGSDNEDAFSDGVNDYQKEKSNEASEVDNEEVEDEMDVLAAMVARRKTMEKVSEDIPELMTQPLATSTQEVALEHVTLENTNKNGGDMKPRRRRAKSTRTNERDGSNLNPDSNVEETRKRYDDEHIKKREGGGRKDWSGEKSKVDNEHKQIRKGGRRQEKNGKKRSSGERRFNQHGISSLFAVNENYLNMFI